MSMPLEGTKVLDFTRHMAGPYATVLMSDYGAEVIKIESVPSGDPTRGMGLHDVGGVSAMFLMWNRGKKSVALDMRDERARKIVHDLVAEADVLIENYRPGVAEQIGIGYEEMSKINPGLVYCSVSAFGPSGPYADYPGTDPVIQAMSGVMSVTGEKGRGPVLAGVPVADFTGAMVALQGVLMALLAREKDGRGQKVDVSMLHALMFSLSTRLASYWATGENPVRHGSEHSVVVPYQAFESSDGWFVAGVWADNAWPPFCKAIEREDLIEHPDFATNRLRVANRDELLEILLPLFRERTTAEWEAEFRRARGLFGEVLEFSELLEHPQVVETGIVTELEHPTLGPLPQMRPPIDFSATPGEPQSPPPLLGQHTAEVLAGVGVEADQLSTLVEDGVAIVSTPGSADE